MTAPGTTAGTGVATIGPLRDPATCRHAVHSGDMRTGKNLDKKPVMRGKCMWCDAELMAPLGSGWGVGPEFALASPSAPPDRAGDAPTVEGDRG